MWNVDSEEEAFAWIQELAVQVNGKNEGTEENKEEEIVREG